MRRSRVGIEVEAEKKRDIEVRGSLAVGKAVDASRARVKGERRLQDGGLHLEGNKLDLIRHLAEGE